MNWEDKLYVQLYKQSLFTSTMSSRVRCGCVPVTAGASDDAKNMGVCLSVPVPLLGLEIAA